MTERLCCLHSSSRVLPGRGRAKVPLWAAMEQTSGGYGFGDAYYEDDSIVEWSELRCVEAGAGGSGGGDGVRRVAFDPIKELLWVLTDAGMLHAHHAADCARVVSVYAGAAADIAVAEGGVLVAGEKGLDVLGRGGVRVGGVLAETVSDARGVALSPVCEGHACIGGGGRMLAVVDWTVGRILRQATLRGGNGVTCASWIAPDPASSLALFATATGRVSLCDPSSMREVNAVAAFAGAATSIASRGYYLAVTGCGTRGGVSYLEQHIKLFDIRALDAPLPYVTCTAPPTCITFDSWAADVVSGGDPLWALSPDGVLQCLEISAVANGQPPVPVSAEMHLDAAADAFSCMAVSPQGLLVMGDTGGFIHQWSPTDSAKVNEHSEPIWLSPVATEPPPPSIQLSHMLAADLGVTIPKCDLPDFQNGYLTDLLFSTPSDRSGSRSGTGSLRSAHPPAMDPAEHAFLGRRAFARFPPKISPSILHSAKYQTFIGYAQASSGFMRNCLSGESVSGHEPPPVVQGMPKRGATLPRARSSGEGLAARAAGSSHREGDGNAGLDLSLPSSRSAYVEMDLVAWESMEGFDFLLYNKSALFCGLENALPNVYVNPAVQALYFTPPLRQAMAVHSCDRESCISCELGFLFHMFDLGGAGMACEASNFTKAFMTMANAGALGLLDGPTALPLSQRIENFTRYLLEQLHKDDDLGGESAVSTLFGAETASFGKFTPSENEWKRESRPFQHTLSYDSDQGAAPTTFAELVSKSLFRTLEPTRAFCEATGQFEMMSQQRVLRSLPNVMLLGCNTKAASYERWWCGDGYKAANSSTSPSSRVMREQVAQAAIARGHRLASSMHMEIEVGAGITVLEDNVESGDKQLATPNFGYDRGPEGTESGTAESSDTGDLCADYDLSFVIAHVPPTAEEADSSSATGGAGRNLGGHLVAYVRVPAEYRRQRKSGSSEADGGDENEWWCFNDFVISPCSGFGEVAAFDMRWKRPCVLGYVRRDIAQRLPPSRPVPVLDPRDILGRGGDNGAVGLGPDEEVPGPGTLLALDAEFVMVGRDEAHIFGDGTRRLITPARLALGRVSVIRGDGPLKGTSLMDDFVQVREPVVDYLTRFSGLTEGDLDPARSAHKVSALKTVYKRLRCLVDAGCVFVGHGLKKDLRIINFVVPVSQVIDTVTLFRLPKKRLLGLRFLASTLLGGDIQTKTHDSIEDADAALRLYDVYQRLRGDGRAGSWEDLLKRLYSYGYAHGWKASEAEPFVVDA